MTPFSVDMNILPAHFYVEYIELKSDIKLKKKKNDRASLAEFCKISLNKDKYPLLHSGSLFMSVWEVSLKKKHVEVGTVV